jgi:hypothetical protein
MIGFEVRLNGKTIATVGVGDLGVLTGVVSFVQRDVPARYRKKVPRKELDLRVGGLITDPKYAKEHVDWVKQRLAAGDRVQFRVVKTDKIDSPPWRTLEDPQEVEKGERRYFEYLKRKFGRRPKRPRGAG